AHVSIRKNRTYDRGLKTESPTHRAALLCTRAAPQHRRNAGPSRPARRAAAQGGRRAAGAVGAVAAPQRAAVAEDAAARRGPGALRRRVEGRLAHLARVDARVPRGARRRVAVARAHGGAHAEQRARVRRRRPGQLDGARPHVPQPLPHEPRRHPHQRRLVRGRDALRNAVPRVRVVPRRPPPDGRGARGPDLRRDARDPRLQPPRRPAPPPRVVRVGRVVHDGPRAHRRGDAPPEPRAPARGREGAAHAGAPGFDARGVLLPRVALLHGDAEDLARRLQPVLAHVRGHGPRQLHRRLDAPGRRRRRLPRGRARAPHGARAGPRLLRDDPGRRHDVRVVPHPLPQARARPRQAGLLVHRLWGVGVHRRLRRRGRPLRGESDADDVFVGVRRRVLLQERDHRALPAAPGVRQGPGARRRQGPGARRRQGRRARGARARGGGQGRISRARGGFGRRPAADARVHPRRPARRLRARRRLRDGQARLRQRLDGLHLRVLLLEHAHARGRDLRVGDDGVDGHRHGDHVLRRHGHPHGHGPREPGRRLLLVRGGARGLLRRAPRVARARAPRGAHAAPLLLLHLRDPVPLLRAHRHPDARGRLVRRRRLHRRDGRRGRRPLPAPAPARGDRAHAPGERGPRRERRRRRGRRTRGLRGRPRVRRRRARGGRRRRGRRRHDHGRRGPPRRRRRVPPRRGPVAEQRLHAPPAHRVDGERQPPAHPVGVPQPGRHGDGAAQRAREDRPLAAARAHRRRRHAGLRRRVRRHRRDARGHRARGRRRRRHRPDLRGARRQAVLLAPRGVEERDDVFADLHARERAHHVPRGGGPPAEPLRRRLLRPRAGLAPGRGAPFPSTASGRGRRRRGPPRGFRAVARLPAVRRRVAVAEEARRERRPLPRRLLRLRGPRAAPRRRRRRLLGRGVLRGLDALRLRRRQRARARREDARRRALLARVAQGRGVQLDAERRVEGARRRHDEQHPGRLRAPAVHRQERAAVERLERGQPARRLREAPHSLARRQQAVLGLDGHGRAQGRVRRRAQV
ncbi:expressed protein, partial [Aureococcus anophagefferens]